MLVKYLKRGICNTTAFGFSAILIRAISFIFLPYFLSHLTLAEFGIWDFYQQFFSLGTQILASCAAISLIRFYLLYQDDSLKQKQATGNAFLFVALCSIVCPLVIIIILPLFNVFPTENSYIYITITSIGFFSLFSMVISFLRVQEKLLHYLFFYCGQSLIAVLLTVIGIHYHYGIKAFFYANLFSFFIFSPMFIYYFRNHWQFSVAVFKEQLCYSIPILCASLLYSNFFTLDRFFLKSLSDYETLGIYSLLWRFGAIFQIVSIALMDASPVLFFNAQKEKNSDYIITKMLSYFCIILTSFCLLAVAVARVAIEFIFPFKLHFLITYLPFFFFPLVIIEIARFLQISFGLSKKTFYMPLITIITLLVQSGLLYIFVPWGISGVLLANTCSFIVYALISYWSSKKFTKVIIESQRILELCVYFMIYLVLLNSTFIGNMHWHYGLLIVASWIIPLWIRIVTNDEKQWIKNFTKKSLKTYIKALCTRTLSEEISFNTILYLRTDICSQEIKSGGSITHTLGVIQGFIHSGSTIICASSAMKSILEKTTKITFIPLKVWPLFCCMRWKLGYLRWHLDCFFSTFFFSLQVKKIFKKEKINAIYQRYSLLNFTGVLLSRIKKIPLILEYNGSEVWVFRIWAKKEWLHLMGLAKIIEYINIEAADYIVVVSQALKDELISRNIDAQKILVNPNGVNTQEFNPDNLTLQRTALHKRYALEDKFVFGFIGTFSYWHGIEVLAQMIPHIVKLQPQTHFMLIGDGPLKKYLENELEKYHIFDHITFTGTIPHHKAKEYLAVCDTFLSPTQPNSDGTRFFGSPTKIFEYLSMAKPIIASDLEQLAQLINPAIRIDDLASSLVIDQQVGFLIAPTNVEHFIQAACFLITRSNPELQKIGLNARRKAVENYTWNKHVENIQHFISNKDVVMKNSERKHYVQRTS